MLHVSHCDSFILDTRCKIQFSIQQTVGTHIVYSRRTHRATIRHAAQHKQICPQSILLLRFAVLLMLFLVLASRCFVLYVPRKWFTCRQNERMTHSTHTNDQTTLVLFVCEEYKLTELAETLLWFHFVAIASCIANAPQSWIERCWHSNKTSCPGLALWKLWGALPVACIHLVYSISVKYYQRFVLHSK